MIQLVRCAVVALAFAMSPGCDTVRYAGIDLRPSAVPAELQALARDARAGDKRAQFRLGERYESGDGVARDRARAMALYRAAATESGGMLTMFVPLRSGAVSVVPVSTGTAVAGLPEAQAKLEKMHTVGVCPPAQVCRPTDSDGPAHSARRDLKRF